MDARPAWPWPNRRSLAQILDKRGLLLRTDLLKPLVNWRTPDFAHRRFDTRYFAATVPMGQQPACWRPGRLGPLGQRRNVIGGRGTTALGDEVGQENTVGLPLGQLLVPGSEIMLEKMAAANGCIAYLSYKRKAHVYQPTLVEEDGRLMLEVEAAKTPRRTAAGALTTRKPADPSPSYCSLS